MQHSRKLTAEQVYRLALREGYSEHIARHKAYVQAVKYSLAALADIAQVGMSIDCRRKLTDTCQQFAAELDRACEQFVAERAGRL